MNQARFYDTNGVPIQEIAGTAADFFRHDSFDATTYLDYAGRTVIQIGKQRPVRYIFGLGLSLTVIITPQSDNRVLVELGGETWGDKVASGAVGALVLFPLMFTAAYGAWKQSELDDRFWEFLAGYIFSRSGRPATFVSAVPVYNGSSNQSADVGRELREFFVPPPPPAPAGGVQPTYGNQGYQAYQNSSYGYATYNPTAQPPYPAPQVAPTYTPSFNNRASWFDQTNLNPVFEQHVGRMISWQTAMADGVIKPEELNEQQERIDKLQKQADEMLDTNARLKLAETLAAVSQLELLQRSTLS